MVNMMGDKDEEEDDKEQLAVEKKMGLRKEDGPEKRKWAWEIPRGKCYLRQDSVSMCPERVKKKAKKVMLTMTIPEEAVLNELRPEEGG